MNCLVVAACFAVAAGLLISRHYGNSIARVDLGDYTPPIPGSADDGGSAGPNGSPDESGETAGSAPTPDEAFPEVDPEAKNFLITGADNNECIDPNSPFAGAFENRDELGQRSDTIMLIRVDPASRRAAILSFPRDLWVEVRGGGHRKINETYDGDDPRPLIETIGENFYLGVDHYIQIDFCAFQTIVDAVDGVSVPFEHPARDVNTGLNVPEPGCFTFTGDHALAYVRSRHYESMDESGQWILDPTSDLGRISRQSDFVRRVLSSALASGFNPSTARKILSAVTDYVVVDDELTGRRMIEFAGLLADLEPGSIATYQIQSEVAEINKRSVQLPRIKGDNMQAILAIFRGQAPLAGAPQQVAEGPGSSTPPPGGTAVESTTPAAEQNNTGVVPPNTTCP